MASFKCPDCGATLTDDSRFCKYCGAKIDDGVKRIEVKIDKRIEDVAEVQRANYEEKESKARVKAMEREHKEGRFKRILMLSILIISAALAVPSVFFNVQDVWIIFGLVGIFVVPFTLFGIIWMMIKGRW